MGKKEYKEYVYICMGIFLVLNIFSMIPAIGGGKHIPKENIEAYKEYVKDKEDSRISALSEGKSDEYAINRITYEIKNEAFELYSVKESSAENSNEFFTPFKVILFGLFVFAMLLPYFVVFYSWIEDVRSINLKKRAQKLELDKKWQEKMQDPNYEPVKIAK